MSPRPKVDHLRKPQIIAAAAEVLYERGLFDTRIGDIAERAGTSSPTILYYFESKDRLLEEAVEYADRSFYARLSEGQGHFEAPATGSCTSSRRRASGPAGSTTTRCGWRSGSERGATRPFARSYFRLDRRQRVLIADIVREGQESGAFSSDTDPDDFALMLSGLMDGLGVQVTLGQPDVTPERMVDRCLALASAELGCRLTRSGPPVAEPRRKGAHS